MSKEKFVGTWESVSAELLNPPRKPFGEEPIGYLMYDAGGHMCVLGMNSTRELFKDPDPRHITPEEALAAFTSLAGYFGTYTVEGNTVTHDVKGSCIPNQTGTKQKRRFEFLDDNCTLRLILLDDNENETGVYFWKRIWPLEAGEK